MSASAVLWPKDTVCVVQGFCCFNAQTCSGFSMHSILCLSKLGKQHPELSAATCSNPVITGPSVPSKNHNWNHLSICFPFSSPKLLHGEYYICKCNSGALTEALLKKKTKTKTNVDNLVQLTFVWYHELQKSGGAVKNGSTLSFHPIIACVEDKENIINPRGKWLFSRSVIQTSVYIKGARVLPKDMWAMLWKCLRNLSAPSLLPRGLLFVFS